MTFNSFQVNTYLVWDENGDCLVVDPAFYTEEEKSRFENFITTHALRISGQVNTHCHIDHVLGIHYLKARYNQPFRAHRGETPIAASAHRMGEIFGLAMDPLPEIDEFIEDGEQVRAGKHSLHTLVVPGHSPGGIALYDPEGGFVIAGDALFSGSIGRTDLPGGDHQQLIHSIQTRLLTLPPDTRVYPGHGPSTIIGKEARENPFLTMAE
jgi:glyoxylase-like metal-dependent hydrolase (beta-lactamase superfamily II)